MKAIRLPSQTAEQIANLAELYQSTKDVRLRQRAQLVLLAAEKNMVAREIAEIVRLDEQSVRRWLKRYRQKALRACGISHVWARRLWSPMDIVQRWWRLYVGGLAV